MPLPLAFTPDETALLGRTADALCAYLGKPVIAEVVAEPGEGFEWVLFAIPLDPADTDEDIAHVQAGGPDARILGSQGGLNFSDGTPLDCKFLWAIQLSDQKDARFVKVDAQGEEIGWSETLEELLPFGLGDEPAPEQDGRDDLEDDDDQGPPETH
ncbi:MAG: hypothetical protein EPN31_05640 [Castellaniella sp.]|uniref:hypothetical protein n=1 Tax=Castellaniella sp. TaxID=1955812 RepID=UPI001217A49B|nr:hypothetical protein [Castellaniella sp.]TAN29716.1 MAG: hypothetical protein EPN31_05640 [Castellaniella sp.]